MIIPVDEKLRIKEKTVVCLGFFDGVHIGHAAIIAQARHIASQNGWTLCVHTYDRPPRKVLFPGEETLELTGLEEKAELLHALGADVVAVSPFDENMIHKTGEAFFHEIVCTQLNAAHVVVGQFHVFGYHGDTSAGRLEELCAKAGIGVTVVPQVCLEDGTPVSSTEIRRAISSGNMKLVEKMLGRKMKQATT